MADFHTVGPDVVIVITIVPGVGVGTHFVLDALYMRVMWVSLIGDD